MGNYDRRTASTTITVNSKVAELKPSSGGNTLHHYWSLDFPAILGMVASTAIEKRVREMYADLNGIEKSLKVLGVHVMPENDPIIEPIAANTAMLRYNVILEGENLDIPAIRDLLNGMRYNIGRGFR